MGRNKKSRAAHRHSMIDLRIIGPLQLQSAEPIQKERHFNFRSNPFRAGPAGGTATQKSVLPSRDRKGCYFNKLVAVMQKSPPFDHLCNKRHYSRHCAAIVVTKKRDRRAAISLLCVCAYIRPSLSFRRQWPDVCKCHYGCWFCKAFFIHQRQHCCALLAHHGVAARCILMQIQPSYI
jgi:hypothetical protein